MNPDKKDPPLDKKQPNANDKDAKNVDVVETPKPPQHMDPSKKPADDKSGHTPDKKVKKK